MASRPRRILSGRKPAPKSRSEICPLTDTDSESIYDNTFCTECESGGHASKLLLCDSCDRGFHIFCLRPILVSVPKGSWLCPSCTVSIKPKAFPLVQTKIIDFFRIRRSSEFTPKFISDSTDTKRRQKPRIGTKKKRKLLPFTPSEDPTRRMEQMASLATALIATGANFSNELTYMPGMAPRSANRASLEHNGMQVLSREGTASLNLCKSMMERGEWPPLMVVYDPLVGFTVEADKLIKDLTIIAEYVGDVDYLKNREDDDGDSIMTLLFASHTSKSLVICPDKRTNISRFISGINNHTPDGKKKQNLNCVRYDVNGESRALLISIRDIWKGERLYYNYNGHVHEYPTHNFV